jgi:hypothetical protein
VLAAIGRIPNTEALAPEAARKLASAVMSDAIFTHPLLAEGLNTLFAMLDATVSADPGSS